MAMYAVTDPRTGELLREFPTTSDAQLEATCAAAHATRLPWGRETSVGERAAVVRRIAELHLERRDALASTMSREMGKPHAEARSEVDFGAAIYAYYADNAAEYLADEEITLLEGTGSAVLRRSPVGALLGIMPWNFPVYQVARFAAPNLTLGNTILLKHAPSARSRPRHCNRSSSTRVAPRARTPTSTPPTSR